MKKLKMIALVLTLFCINRATAQMGITPFQILNAQNCDITVHYEVTDCLGLICNNAAVVINPGAYFVVPCGSPGDDIYVWLKEMDYVDITNGGNTTFAVTSGGCFGSTQTMVNMGLINVALSMTCTSPSSFYSLTCTPGLCIIGY